MHTKVNAVDFVDAYVASQDRNYVGDKTLICFWIEDDQLNVRCPDRVYGSEGVLVWDDDSIPDYARAKCVIVQDWRKRLDEYGGVEVDDDGNYWLVDDDTKYRIDAFCDWLCMNSEIERGRVLAEWAPTFESMVESIEAA